MAFRHGKDSAVVIGEADVSAYFTSMDTTNEVDTPEVTTFGGSTDSRVYIAGLLDGSASLQGFWDGSAEAVDETLEALLAVEDSATYLLQFGNETTETTGLRCVFGVGDAMSYDISTPFDNVTSISFDIDSDGGQFGGYTLHEPNGSTSPALQDTGTVSTDNASVDNSASSANGWTAQLHVVANTLDGNLVVTVEDSSDDATFATLTGGAFATVGAGTTTSEQITSAAGDTAVDRYVRINVDASAATTGDATIAVAFTRKTA